MVSRRVPDYFLVSKKVEGLKRHLRTERQLTGDDIGSDWLVANVGEGSRDVCGEGPGTATAVSDSSCDRGSGGGAERWRGKMDWKRPPDECDECRLGMKEKRSSV